MKSTVFLSMSASSSSADRGQPRFGVAHRRGIVAVDRAEISLPIDEGIAQVEVLRHADEGVVDGGIAVRVVVLEHFADDTGALAIASVRCAGPSRASRRGRGDGPV